MCSAAPPTTFGAIDSTPSARILSYMVGTALGEGRLSALDADNHRLLGFESR